MTKIFVDKLVLEQALEALEYYQHRRLEWDYSDEVAITALRAALAEPVQEPVAWMDIASDGTRLAVRMWSDGNSEEVPLYTAPSQRPAEPVQEPLDPDIAKIVNDNLWNLYVEEPEESVQETVDEREHIGYIEREEGYYKLYAPPKDSIVTQAFILCKYCDGYIYSCSGPKLDAICFHCYNKDPELR